MKLLNLNFITKLIAQSNTFILNNYKSPLALREIIQFILYKFLNPDVFI